MNSSKNALTCHTVEEMFLAAFKLKGASALADKELAINILKDLSDRKLFGKVGMMDEQIPQTIWKQVWDSMYAAKSQKTYFKQKVIDGSRKVLAHEGIENSAAADLLLGMGTVLNYPKAMLETVKEEEKAVRQTADPIRPSYVSSNSTVRNYVHINPIPAFTAVLKPRPCTTVSQSGHGTCAAPNHRPPVKQKSASYQAPDSRFDIDHTGYFRSAKTSMQLLLVGWGLFALNVCYIVFGLMNDDFLGKSPAILAFVFAACSIAALNFIERFRGHGKLARSASIIFTIWFGLGNSTAWYIQHGQKCSVSGATWKFFLIQLVVLILAMVIGGRIGEHQNITHRRFT